MSRLSRQCGILNISLPYRSPRPVRGIFFYLLHGLSPRANYTDRATFYFTLLSHDLDEEGVLLGYDP
jgi:hypothetical protein